MAVTKVRKFGTDQVVDVEHGDDDCPFCQAARGVTGSGVIFLEAAGIVHRVDIQMAGDRTCVMVCQPVTQAEAEAELSESRKG